MFIPVHDPDEALKFYRDTAFDETRRETTMKAMTCKPLGGPCDQEHHGDTADETIRSQDQHLKDAVASGDDVHRAAHDDMTWRWRRPISGMRRYRRTKQAVADLPERQ